MPELDPSEPAVPQRRSAVRAALRPRVLAGVLGVGAVAWGVIAPHGPAYLAGCILLAAAVLLVVRDGMRRRAGRSGARVAGAAVALALLVPAVLVPAQAEGDDSGVLWRVGVGVDAPPLVLPVGDRILLAGSRGVRLLDARTGDEVARWSTERPIRQVSDAGAGHVLVTDEQEHHLHDLTGAELWRRPAVGVRGGVPAIAAQDGVVVLEDQADGVIRAVAPDGSDLWSRGGAAHALDVAFPGEPGEPVRLPTTALFRAAGSEDVTAVEPATGAETAVPPGFLPAAAAGATVLWVSEGADGCEATGTTGAVVRWTAPVPCIHGVRQVMDRRALYSVLHDDAEDRAVREVTVDLATGGVRDLADLSTDGRRSDPATAMSSDVLVSFTGAGRTAVLATRPSTDDELWQFRTRGRDLPLRVADVTGTGVVLLSDATGLNPFRDDSGTEVTVLDAASGEATATLRCDGFTAATSTAPGQALVVTHEPDHTDGASYAVTLVGTPSRD